MVEFARARGIPVRGHFLVPNIHIPEWLAKGTWSKEELEKILVEHIETVVGHFCDRYPGQIISWDVVNEIFTDWGNLKSDLFWSKIGNDPLDFVRIAFRAAHRADPSAKLFYNDSGNEIFNLKSSAILKMVLKLRAEGVPIHAVGIQGHVMSLPTQDEVRENLSRFAHYGIEVQITEMDIRVLRGIPLTEPVYTHHGRIYGEMLKLCLEAANCSGFSVWGFTERHTWIPDRMPVWDKKSRPSLLFDQNLEPRPAYHELIRILKAASSTIP